MGGIGRTNAGGGGAVGGSEFVIVGGTVRPSKATENTVWVNTDVEITDYVLSAAEPESPVSGMLWLQIADESDCKISAPVGGDYINLYIKVAKLYVGGAWEDKDFEIYRGGAWLLVPSTFWLYHQGDLCEDVTGGWAQTGDGGSITFNEDNAVVNVNAYLKATHMSTVKPVNVTDLTRIVFLLKSAQSYSKQGYGRIGLSEINTASADPNGGKNYVVSQTLTASDDFVEVEVPVADLVGSYYILISGKQGDAGGNTITVKDIWGE